MEVIITFCSIWTAISYLHLIDASYLPISSLGEYQIIQPITYTTGLQIYTIPSPDIIGIVPVQPEKSSSTESETKDDDSSEKSENKTTQSNNVDSEQQSSNDKNLSDSTNENSSQNESNSSNEKGDASYNFTYSTLDSSRSESSDAQGNVEGKYAYRNNAGEHDLSYKANAETGFILTGGSLAVPNGLVGKQESLESTPKLEDSKDEGDKAYSFSYETDLLSRNESSDTDGNVQGQYAYKDNAGNHDLSYKAADDTGFVITGGNLATPTAATATGVNDVSETSPKNNDNNSETTISTIDTSENENNSELTATEAESSQTTTDSLLTNSERVDNSKSSSDQTGSNENSSTQYVSLLPTILIPSSFDNSYKKIYW